MKKRISLLMILCITISIFTVSTEAVSAYTDINDDALIIVGGKAVKEDMTDKEVNAINTEEVLASKERISNVVSYIIEHFDQKTKRNSFYDFSDTCSNTHFLLYS